MKWLFAAAFLLALTASASAGVYKTIEEIKDRVNNANNEDDLASADINEILEESQDRISKVYDIYASSPNGVYETSEDSITNGNNEDLINNYYNADTSPSAGVNKTFENIEGRITNGHTAYTGQLPYQAFLGIRNYNGPSWCGATLISSEWVLTAAHCIIDAVSVTVYLGSIQRYYGTSRTVPRQNIIMHHGFVRNYNHDDIALIKIPAVSLNSPYIQPVRLPPISNYPRSYAGEYVIASGWGQTTDTNYAGTDYLQWARLPVISNYELSNTYGSINHILNSLCKHSPWRFYFFGDSGGPIVLENSNVQIGISAICHWSRKVEWGYPAGFTRVSNYLDWIRYYTGIYYT
ncbi:hypothetical protein DOY81_008779 [Sarcophaga bullata]|nr:hypothetical protein DOY81_008779 [Sarcophaga bullata]